MFKAVRFSKVRIQEWVTDVRWTDAFRLNEDFLTAAIFARLLYFPSEALSTLLPVFAANPGEIKESGFWPSWSVKAKNGAAIRVEPDVYVQFDDLDLIVEAKLEDNSGGQAADQWAREWAAWYRNEYEPGKQALLLGVGGLGETDSHAQAEAKTVAEGANMVLQTNFPGVPSIQVAGLSWRGIYDRLACGTLGDGVSPQLVRDLREILSYFGLRLYQYLGELCGLTREPWIIPIGLDALGVFERWQKRPNWLESSRSLRPISASSIPVFWETSYGKS